MHKKVILWASLLCFAVVKCSIHGDYLLGVSLAGCILGSHVGHVDGQLVFGAVAAAFASAAGIYKMKGLIYEECDDRWITNNLPALSRKLDEALHGQHLVKEIVTKSVRAHVSRLTLEKPLVMSFHGTTGVGKNFVSQIIVESLFYLGVQSRFVHWFISAVHFPHPSQAHIYKDDLQNWIKGNVSQCGRSVFIFDEVDKMPPGVMDAITPFVDHYDQIDGTDLRQSIFIFISNTGGTEIMNKMVTYWQEGRLRDDLSFMDFQDLIEKGAFNEQGGLFQNSMISRSLIDYYVPFLPLERKHVKMCILDELRSRDVIPSNSMLDQIANEMPYQPEDLNLFSKVGCKRVVQKVDFVLS